MGSPLPGKVSFSSGENPFLFRGKSLILPIPGKVSSFRGTSLPAGENHLSGRLVGPGGEQCTWEVSEKLENMIWQSFWRLFRAPARGLYRFHRRVRAAALAGEGEEEGEGEGASEPCSRFLEIKMQRAKVEL